MSDPTSPQTGQGPSSVSASTVTTVVEASEVDGQQEEIPTLKLRLKKPKSAKKVNWTNETVDNEHMNKKKSKCCCIYEKPRNFDDSSSEEDDECEHCRGHVEKKKKSDALPSDDHVCQH